MRNARGNGFGKSNKGNGRSGGGQFSNDIRQRPLVEAHAVHGSKADLENLHLEGHITTYVADWASKEVYQQALEAAGNGPIPVKVYHWKPNPESKNTSIAGMVEDYSDKIGKKSFVFDENQDKVKFIDPRTGQEAESYTDVLRFTADKAFIDEKASTAECLIVKAPMFTDFGMLSEELNGLKQVRPLRWVSFYKEGDNAKYVEILEESIIAGPDMENAPEARFTSAEEMRATIEYLLDCYEQRAVSGFLVRGFKETDDPAVAADLASRVGEVVELTNVNENRGKKNADGSKMEPVWRRATVDEIMDRMLKGWDPETKQAVPTAVAEAMEGGEFKFAIIPFHYYGANFAPANTALSFTQIDGETGELIDGANGFVQHHMLLGRKKQDRPFYCYKTSGQRAYKALVFDIFDLPLGDLPEIHLNAVYADAQAKAEKNAEFRAANRMDQDQENAPAPGMRR